MSGERSRIEEIKKRKNIREKAMKRKIYMIRRAALIIIALGIITAIVLSIRGCVVSVQTRREEEAARIAAEEAAREAAKPTPTPEPVFNSKGINETFYDNSAFYGNSFIEGMKIYELVSNADYFSRIGLNISQVYTKTTDTGSVPIIEEFDTDKQYSKIFMMFGENEVGWIGNAFFEQYEEMIMKVKQYQPEAKIYLMAITAISNEVSDQDIDGLNIENIRRYNDGIKDIANRIGAVYADIYTVTAGADGYLPDDAATDGIHFGEDYYIKCLEYIQQHYN